MKKYLPVWMLMASVLIIAETAGCKKSEKVHAHNAIILSGSNAAVNTCGWVIQVTDHDTETSPHNSLKPVNLDPQFQNDSMQVKITYTIPDMPVVKCGSDAGYTQISILNLSHLD
ncbi:hypothetical protein [Mucilaginibacter auburnensis]|uniref:Uncharacterized protein n=1 Tax=Mucilaginibacter auburnensis TaxID=1457233 RepID=A0A2H9VTL6_9SPHI|nr:hypothetical protein [Mucilaginibacter auburnensis]PJJ84154.1 hypothetical protein CLV57_1163 [Mucilaginibacter auburnensis]